jgi:hypothetical protein
MPVSQVRGVAMADVPASVRTLAADRRFTQVRPAGAGVEFQVFEATAPDGSKVVLRTPFGERFQSNPNDRNVDTRSLLRWEYVVTRHLDQLGFPVATPRELIVGEPDVLVSDFVADDGRGADQVALGALLLRLHRSPPRRCRRRRPMACRPSTCCHAALPTGSPN